MLHCAIFLHYLQYQILVLIVEEKLQVIFRRLETTCLLYNLNCRDACHLLLSAKMVAIYVVSIAPVRPQRFCG